MYLHTVALCSELHVCAFCRGAGKLLLQGNRSTSGLPFYGSVTYGQCTSGFEGITELTLLWEVVGFMFWATDD